MLRLHLLLLIALTVVRGTSPEDLYAFPKYRVVFLNGLPVSNETAQKWLTDGLQGGDLEFLDQWRPSPRNEIASPSSQSQPETTDQSSEQPPRLEHMRLGPSKSYLCLIPPAPLLPPPVSDEAVTPSHSWSLLQPLSGTCLYHRQPWFTYSYCHNLHVRQFRELPATHSHPSGARVIEEDPEWKAYTLGKSPTAQHSVDGQLAANDELALATNLELARQSAGQRYLVQRWGDGTVCDQTGRPREIEVQFHCSMTMTDTVMFVKETRTCEYVLVIHTPRLCGEPGFKSRRDQIPESAIRCRHILDPGVEPSSPRPSDPLAESIHPHRKGGPSRPRPPVPDKKAADPTVVLDEHELKFLKAILGKDKAVVFELYTEEEDGEGSRQEDVVGRKTESEEKKKKEALRDEL